MQLGRLTTRKASMVLSIAGCFLPPFVAEAWPDSAVLSAILLIGSSGSAVQTLNLSILGDCIRHGSNSPLAKFSQDPLNEVFLSGEKLRFGANALVCGIVFVWTGLVITQAGVTEQSAEAISGVKTGMHLGVR